MNIEFNEKNITFKILHLNKDIIVNVSAYSVMYHQLFHEDSKILKINKFYN